MSAVGTLSNHKPLFGNGKTCEWFPDGEAEMNGAFPMQGSRL